MPAPLRRSARLAGQAAVGIDISALPIPVLSRIIVLAGTKRTMGMVATRVSKRWYEAVYATPELWRSFLLRAEHLLNLTPEEQESWMAVRRRVLERVASAVASLTLEWDQHGATLPSPYSLPEFLQLLRPATLDKLSLVCGTLPGPVAAEVCRFTSLTSLRLSIGEATQGDVEAMLAAMPRLTDLTWRGYRPLPAWLPSAVADRLPKLQALSLQSNKAFPDSMAQLTRLTTLRSLHIHSLCLSAGRLPLPASFAGLQQYEWRTERGQVQVAGVDLENVRFVGDENGSNLLLHGVRSLPSLASLLAALIPPSAGSRPLRELSFKNATLEAPALTGCGDHLSTLTSLDLAYCNTPWHHSDVPSVLGVLLPAAPALTALRVEGCCLPALPDCVISRRGITHLMLELNELRKRFPKGPYLEDLVQLDLGWNHVKRLPVALKRAPKLRRLSLHGNGPLDAKDIDSVLATMPALEVLDLSNTGTPRPVLQALRARLPGVSILLSSRKF